MSRLARLAHKFAIVRSYQTNNGGHNLYPIVSPETLNGVYGANKAFVIALSHSLQHELADKGIRIQAVLPGGTLTGDGVEALNGNGDPAGSYAHSVPLDDVVALEIGGL